VSDASGPLAAADPNAANNDANALPRVVVVVRALNASELAGREAFPQPSATEAVGSEVSAAAEAVGIAASTEPTDEDTRRYDTEQVKADATATAAEVAKERIAATKSVGIEPEDVPTERFVLEMKRQRTPADDRLAAAIVVIDFTADPDPLTPFLGPCLLERAARAAEIAGAPRLLLVAGSCDADQRDLSLQAAQRGFRGPVETYDEDPTSKDIGPGRVLLLDGTALHDGRALSSLAKVRGETTALLLTQYGDGLRVRTESGKVVEVGTDVQPNDGALAGACSCPAESYEAMSSRGQSSVLDRLSREELLVGRVDTESHSRQFRDRHRADQAQRFCYDALAASKTDGLLEQWIGRPIARALTLALLLKKGVTPTHVLVFAGLLGVAAAALLALGHSYLAPVAGLLLVLSAVLDRSDGELARLRLDDRPRPLDFLLDHVILGLVLLGLAWGIHQPPSGVGGWEASLNLLPEAATTAIAGRFPVTALFVGLAGAVGVALMLAVSAWRGPPDPHSRGMERVGDLIASSFGSRDYAYVLLLAGILHAILPDRGLLGIVLLLCTAGVHGFWLLLFLVQTVTPRRRK
jgi:phosphatidylglycerophosphate synthase